MPIEVVCQCGKTYHVGDAMAGKQAQCKACGQTVHIPESQAFGLDPLPMPFEYNVAKVPERAVSTPLVQHDALSSVMVNSSTYASNPGRTRINFSHYLTCHPSVIFVSAITYIVGFAWAAIVWNPLPLIFSGVGLWVFISTLLGERSKLIGGDVCPAIVISDRPYRIAVYTDMTTGGAERPAILIIKAPLARMTGGPPAVGQRLATAAFYNGDSQKDAWANLQPTVLACATRNEADIARVTASIPPDQWYQLESSLAQLPSRKEGLHKLWLGKKNN